MRRAAKARIADEGEAVGAEAGCVVLRQLAGRGKAGDALARDAEQPRFERLAIAVEMVRDLRVLDVPLKDLAVKGKTGIEGRCAPTAKIIEPERVNGTDGRIVHQQAGSDVPIQVEADDGVDRRILDELAQALADGFLRQRRLCLHFFRAKKSEQARLGIIAHVGRNPAAFQRGGEIVGGLGKGGEKVVAQDEDAFRQGGCFHASAFPSRCSQRCSSAVRWRAFSPVSRAAEGSRKTCSAAASRASSESARIISSFE